MIEIIGTLLDNAIQDMVEKLSCFIILLFGC